jgi:hypothetical protein
MLITNVVQMDVIYADFVVTMVTKVQVDMATNNVWMVPGFVKHPTVLILI